MSAPTDIKERSRALHTWTTYRYKDRGTNGLGKLVQTETKRRKKKRRKKKSKEEKAREIVDK